MTANRIHGCAINHHAMDPGLWRPRPLFHVAALQAKHEGLEQRIREEMARPAPDSTMIQTLKKQKLKIKEAIAFG